MTETYLTIRHAPLGAYLGICDGSRHVLAAIGDPGVPVGAQRRLNAAGTSGKPVRQVDMAEVSGWLDRHGEHVQGELFAA